jgi:hypothetical protein
MLLQTLADGNRDFVRHVAGVAVGEDLKLLPEQRVQSKLEGLLFVAVLGHALHCNPSVSPLLRRRKAIRNPDYAIVPTAGQKIQKNVLTVDAHNRKILLWT